MHLDLDLAERASVAVTFEAVSSLVDFYQANPNTIGFSPPLMLGRDIRRQLGDGMGFPIWSELMLQFDDPLTKEELLPGDTRTPITMEQYQAKLVEEWADHGQGAPRAYEMLLVDAMARAREQGWKIGNEVFVLDDAPAVRAATEAILDDLARRSGAKRAAVEADRSAAELREDEASFARIEALYGPQLPPLPTGTPMPAPYLQAVPAAPKQPNKLIQSSREFVANFVAPSFLIDGVIQKQNVYALTAAPGTGKTAIAMRISAHVALGRKLGDRDVERGRVLYFAAENYVDVQARLIAMAEHCGFDVNAIEIYFVAGTSKLSEIADRVTAEAQALGDLALVIVDTSAATFEGSDENSNVDGLVHAKRMRSLTELRGKPTVLVLCHPVKSATTDNLLPRGGSAFFGEIDGNLCARKNDSAVEMHWFGKIRGMDFAPIAFRLDTVVADSLKDARGRKMPTVLATPIDDASKQVMAATERSDQDRVLRAIFERPGESSNEIAKHLAWAMRDGKPYGVRVRRAAERMAGDGLLMKHRGEWVLSARGEKELNNLDRKTAVPSGTSAVPVLPPLPSRNAH
jgi:AAA domain